MSTKNRKNHSTIRCHRALSHAERDSFVQGSWTPNEDSLLTTKQYRTLNYVAHARHQFHSHIDRMWKGFEEDDWNLLPNPRSRDVRHKLGNINYRLRNCGLPLVPFQKGERFFTIDDWNNGKISPAEKLYWEEIARQDSYYRGAAREYWEQHAQQATYRYLEHCNVAIEQYLQRIDRANGTHFHPSYSSRLHSAKFVSAEAAMQTMKLIHH